MCELSAAVVSPLPFSRRAGSRRPPLLNQSSVAVPSRRRVSTFSPFLFKSGSSRRPPICRHFQRATQAKPDTMVVSARRRMCSFPCWSCCPSSSIFPTSDSLRTAIFVAPETDFPKFQYVIVTHHAGSLFFLLRFLPPFVADTRAATEAFP